MSDAFVWMLPYTSAHITSKSTLSNGDVRTAANRCTKNIADQHARVAAEGSRAAACVRKEVIEGNRLAEHMARWLGKVTHLAKNFTTCPTMTGRGM